MSLFRQMEKLRQTTENTAARFNVHTSTDCSLMDDCDSWVELAPPSRGSLCSSVDALLLVEAQHQSNYSSNKGSHHSPKSLTSPNVELTSLEDVKARLVKDMLPPGKNTDWIWDWSSRPEALAPKDMRLRHPGGTSSLTTPPNSPAPELALGYPLSLRHSPIMTSVFWRYDVLIGLVVSNIFSIILGAAIGFCISQNWHENDIEF